VKTQTKGQNLRM